MANVGPMSEPDGNPFCRVCGSAATARWKVGNLGRRLVADDLRITDSRYGMTLDLWRCASCGFIQADADELSDLTVLYEQFQDPDYHRDRAARTLQMRRLLARGLEAKPSAETLLDIGAGTGLLVAHGSARGLNAIGIEPSYALTETGRRINNATLLQGTIPHPFLSDRTFDLVYLVDVIEHVPHPVTLLKECVRYLAPGEILVVVTPDVSSLAAKILGKKWWHFRLAHVGYFSPRSLRIAAQAAGQEPVRFLRARWFFPVSYIAERLAVYLPVGGINRLAPRFAPLNWLYQKINPLNLHDSMLFLFKLGGGKKQHE
jgi:SAM-dependent methyltransferase